MAAIIATGIRVSLTGPLSSYTATAALIWGWGS